MATRIRSTRCGMHRERDRASSFGSVAERYDRSRPPYPAAKVADVLDAGGRFGVFWNKVSHRPETEAALLEAYRAHAPEIIKDSVALGTLGRLESVGDAEAIDASGRFEPAELRRYDRDERL